MKGKSPLKQSLTPGTPNPRLQNTIKTGNLPRTANSTIQVPVNNQPRTTSTSFNSYQAQTPRTIFGTKLNNSSINAFGNFANTNSIFRPFSSNNNITSAQNNNRFISPFIQQKNNNMQYNNINKKAFSNIENLKGVMGENIDGTFNRRIGKSPLKQSINPLTGEYLDPAIDLNTGNTVVPPPTGVQTDITPNYDINNF